MRLIHARFENIGPFLEAELSNLAPFTVVVGRNGSGKTFLFEALDRFFTEFQISSGSSTWANSDYYWHARDTSKPLVVEATVVLSEPELERIVAAAKSGDGETIPVADADNQDRFTLRLRRELQYKQSWVTAYLKWGTTLLVSQDKPESGIIVESPRHAEQDIAHWSMELLESPEPSEVTGKRILVNSKNETAFQTGPEFDELAKSGVLSISVAHAGQTQDEAIAALGVSMNEEMPTESVAPELFQAIRSLRAYPADAVTVAIQEAMRNAFKLLPADRAEPRPLGSRTSPLPQALVAQANQLLSDRTPLSETSARRLNQAYFDFTAKRLSPHGTGLEVDDDRHFLPIAYQGGGEQAILDLLWNLSQGGSVVAVEEPEVHLHPSLVRRAFRYLQEQSSGIQVILSTHSPLMVDKSQITNNWVVREEEGISSITQVETRDDLRLVLAELGVLPSDIYLNDIVLFVEGSTERKAVLPTWARKLGIDLESNIGVLAIDGDGNLERYLRTWLVIAKEAPASYFVILDAHAGNVANRLVRELGLDQERVHVWSKNAIEDFYPPDRCSQALRDLYGVEIDVAELRGDGKEKVIGKALADAGRVVRGWKMPFGESVAEAMNASEIDREVAEALYRVAILAGQNPERPPQLTSSVRGPRARRAQ